MYMQTIHLVNIGTTMVGIKFKKSGLNIEDRFRLLNTTDITHVLPV